MVQKYTVSARQQILGYQVSSENFWYTIYHIE